MLEKEKEAEKRKRREEGVGSSLASGGVERPTKNKEFYKDDGTIFRTLTACGFSALADEVQKVKTKVMEFISDYNDRELSSERAKLGNYNGQKFFPATLADVNAAGLDDDRMIGFAGYYLPDIAASEAMRERDIPALLDLGRGDGRLRLGQPLRRRDLPLQLLHCRCARLPARRLEGGLPLGT